MWIQQLKKSRILLAKLQKFSMLSGPIQPKNSKVIQLCFWSMCYYIWWLWMEYLSLFGKYDNNNLLLCACLLIIKCSRAQNFLTRLFPTAMVNVHDASDMDSISICTVLLELYCYSYLERKRRGYLCYINKVKYSM